MQKVVLIPCVLGLLIGGAVLLNGENTAEARPQYLKGFGKKYSNLASQAKTKKCFVCHGKSKKKRNDYAMALGKGLGKKNQKNPETIAAALKKAESAKNAKGVTFGSLIKDGKLPGTPIK